MTGINWANVILGIDKPPNWQPSLFYCKVKYYPVLTIRPSKCERSQKHVYYPETQAPPIVVIEKLANWSHLPELLKTFQGWGVVMEWRIDQLIYCKWDDVAHASVLPFADHLPQAPLHWVHRWMKNGFAPSRKMQRLIEQDLFQSQSAR